MRKLLLSIAAMSAFAAVPASAADKETCGILASRNGKDTSFTLKDFSLTALQPFQELQPLAAPQGYKLNGMWCRRKELVLYRNDNKPLLQGQIFYVFTEDNRAGVLEFSKGDYRFHVLKGKLTAAERVKNKDYLKD